MRSLTSILDGVFLELPLYLRILIILVFLAAAAIFSYRKRFLTLSGVSTAIVLGFIVFFIGGISGIAIFLFFFHRSFFATIHYMISQTAPWCN